MMRRTATAAAGAWADDATVTFVLPDPGHKLAGVRLQQDLRIPADLLNFRRIGDNWELVIKRPPVHRMEYLLELSYPGGGAATVPDPANPLQVAGAFGAKSVVEFPSYLPPAWLSAAAPPGRVSTIELPDRSLGASVQVRTWAPAGTPAGARLPLLVVHDGPEYDSLASLTRYLAAGVAGQWLPRLRAALLSPGPRNRWYSANANYARALRHTVLPALGLALPTSLHIGMGTSLGGLAMLHAHCQYPDAFDALFMQSGSFFMPSFDSQESRFPYYRRITKFTAAVLDGGALPGRPVPAVLTCGAIEENIANNRLMAETLRERGYPATLYEVPDMHNYTAWRDAFDPCLTGLLHQVHT